MRRTEIAVLVGCLATVFMVGVFDCGAQMSTNTPGTPTKFWLTDTDTGTVVIEMRQANFSTSPSTPSTLWNVIDINSANGNPYSGGGNGATDIAGGEGVLAYHVTFATAFAAMQAAAANFTSDRSLYLPGASAHDAIAGSVMVVCGGGIYGNGTSYEIVTAVGGSPDEEVTLPYGPEAPTTLAGVGAQIGAGAIVPTAGFSGTIEDELQQVFSDSGQSASMFSALNIPEPAVPPSPFDIGGLSTNLFGGAVGDSGVAGNAWISGFYVNLPVFVALAVVVWVVAIWKPRRAGR